MTTLKQGYQTRSEHVADCTECQDEIEAERDKLASFHNNTWMPETPIEWPTEADSRNIVQRFLDRLADWTAAVIDNR